MAYSPVIIAGGGIGGLALALTLNEIGVPFIVFEAAHEIRPLGVGINLQPNAIRELNDMRISDIDLETIGVATHEWVLVGRNGKDIYAEPRGLGAGYKWPQYSVHRGQFQMLLYKKLVERAGMDVVQTGCRVTGYRDHGNGRIAALVERKDGKLFQQDGALLIGADGIHSAIRAQMHPTQPPIHWGGAMMWRGTTRARPVRSQASFIGLGTQQQHMVIYPLSSPDPDGTALINWIAEVTFEHAGDQPSGWFKPARVEDFIDHFEGWSFDWLDVPELLRGADAIYENPMIDRDPVSTWHQGRVTLLGDAAHAMYPTGSNGASQAIIDARVLGAMMVAHGVTEAALSAYDAALCGPVSELVLRNRGAGPFGLLGIVDERCGGDFDNIDDIVPLKEREAFMANYKTAAGFAIETLNAAPPTIAPGQKVPTHSG
ncbi:MAG: flavin-dependent oxidoreductase [Hyphomicrobiales bacterium]